MVSSELGREVEAGDRRMAAIEDLQRTGWKRRRESSRAKTGTFQHFWGRQNKPAKESKQWGKEKEKTTRRVWGCQKRKQE